MFDQSLFTHPTLTLDQELALGQRIQAGDQDAIDELVRHNLRLVKSIVRRYWTLDPATTWDDLFQEGLLGLYIAARRFQPERGLKFSTYATSWIVNKVQRAAVTSGTIRRPANRNYQHKKPVSAHAQRNMHPVVRLDAPLRDRKGDEGSTTLADIIADASASVEDQAFANIEFERIFAALKLNERGQAVLRDYLSGLSRREAQKKHGVSSSWLHQMLKQRRKKIMPDQHPICIEPGCDQPCHTSSRGIRLPRCQEHQRTYWRDAKATSNSPDAPPRKRGRPPLSQPATASPPLHAMERGPGGEVPDGEGCTCTDCIYREIVDLLAARNPRIREFVQAMLEARRLLDELGI